MKHRRSPAVLYAMNRAATITGPSSHRDVIVHAPRATDGIGRTLRGAFRAAPLPADMERLVWRLDRLGR